MKLDEVIQQPGQKERVEKDDIMKSIHVAVAGEIVSYNPDKRTATIQPVIRDWNSKENPPLLLDVPVFMWGNFTFTPQKGDGCLVVCADSCVDSWLQSGGVNVPVVARNHSLSDGFAFVGFRQENGVDLMVEIASKINAPSEEGESGQVLKTNGDGTTEWTDLPVPTDAQVEAAVDEWLDDHPEATTTVQDGSITMVKLASDVKGELDSLEEVINEVTIKSPNMVDKSYGVTQYYIISKSNLNAETLVPPLDTQASSAYRLFMKAIEVKPNTVYAFPRDYVGGMSLYSGETVTVSGVTYYKYLRGAGNVNMTDHGDCLLYTTPNYVKYLTFHTWNDHVPLNDFMIIEVEDPQTFVYPNYTPFGYSLALSVPVSNIEDYDVVGKDVENASAIEALGGVVDGLKDKINAKTDMKDFESITVKMINVFDKSVGYTLGYSSPSGGLPVETLIPPHDVEAEPAYRNALINKAIKINPNKLYAFPASFVGRVSLYNTNITTVEGVDYYRRDYYIPQYSMVNQGDYLYFAPPSNGSYFCVALWKADGITQADIDSFMILEFDSVATFTYPTSYIPYGYYISVTRIFDYDIVGRDSILASKLEAITTATAEDVNKALQAKTIMSGEVVEWGFVEAAVVDSTMSESGKAADAKITGDAISALEASSSQIPILESGKVSKPNISPDGVSGQLLQTNGDGTTQWVNVGQPTDAQTAAAISAWLDAHPDATTTVQDGSITKQKLAPGLLPYVTPEMFGAVGDGIEDDTSAIQQAFDCRVDVYFKEGATYKITSPVVLDNTGRVFGVHYYGNGCTISHLSSHAFYLSSAVSKGMTFCVIEGFNMVSGGRTYYGMYVLGGAPAAGSNYLQECEIKNCTFNGQKLGMYLGAYRLKISQCYFIGCDTALLDDCVNNCIIENCFFIGNTLALQMNVPYFTTVINNTFHANTIAIRVDGAETPQVGCNIIGNIFRSGTTSVPQKHIYIFMTHDIIIDNNFFDGGATYDVHIFNSKNVILKDSMCLGNLLVYFDAGYGDKVYVRGGYYRVVTVGSVDSDIYLSDLNTTLISTNVNIYPRSDRYINIENVNLVYNENGTDARLGSGIEERLKNSSISAPNTRYDYKSVGNSVFKLILDVESNRLVWESVS